MIRSTRVYSLADRFRWKCIHSASSQRNDVAEIQPKHDEITNLVPKICFVSSVKKEILSLHDALRCLRAYSLCPTPETVDLNMNINMVLKKNKKKDPFRGTLIFPFRFGKEQRVLVVAEDEFLQEAEEADTSGNESIIQKLEKDIQSLDFDVCLCTPNMYEKMKHLQRTLRAKMPNLRRGTVVVPEELKKAVINFQQSKTFKCNKQGVANMSVGKLDFEDSKIEANIKCVLGAINEHRGTLTKASFLQRATLSTNFGPGFILTLEGLL